MIYGLGGSMRWIILFSIILFGACDCPAREADYCIRNCTYSYSECKDENCMSLAKQCYDACASITSKGEKDEF